MMGSANLHKKTRIFPHDGPMKRHAAGLEVNPKSRRLNVGGLRSAVGKCWAQSGRPSRRKPGGTGPKAGTRGVRRTVHGLTSLRAPASVHQTANDQANSSSPARL